MFLWVGPTLKWICIVAMYLLLILSIVEIVRKNFSYAKEYRKYMANWFLPGLLVLMLFSLTYMLLK